MSMEYRHGMLRQNAMIKSLLLVIGFSWLMIAFLMYLCVDFKKEQIVRLPADLRYTVRQQVSATPESHVYSFAYYIIQQVYRWEQDGAEDFPQNIYRLQAFLTQRMRKQLETEFELKSENNELKRRVRWVQEIPGHTFSNQRVEKLSDGSWVVHVDLHIREFVGNYPLKDVHITYPIRVVHYDVDPEKNDYGLALDGFSTPGPQKLSVSKEGDEAL